MRLTPGASSAFTLDRGRCHPLVPKLRLGTHFLGSSASRHCLDTFSGRGHHAAVHTWRPDLVFGALTGWSLTPCLTFFRPNPASHHAAVHTWRPDLVFGALTFSPLAARPRPFGFRIWFFVLSPPRLSFLFLFALDHSRRPQSIVVNHLPAPRFLAVPTLPLARFFGFRIWFFVLSSALPSPSGSTAPSTAPSFPAKAPAASPTLPLLAPRPRSRLETRPPLRPGRTNTQGPKHSLRVADTTQTKPGLGRCCRGPS
jgi:hypothetical protein